MKRLDKEAEALNLPNSSRPSVPSEVEIRNARSKDMVAPKAKDDFVVVDKNVVISVENVDKAVRQIRVRRLTLTPK